MTTLATSTDPTDPTRDQWAAYTLAFDYFNRTLFGDALPRLILNHSRHARSMGFFSPLRWVRENVQTHEISLNPDVLNRPVKDTMSTLVHEMVHEWQHEFGTPSRRGYHNREWAAKMEAVGLMPSDTGQPGGHRTGQRVTHYIIPGGPFDVAFQAMPPEYLLPWLSGAPTKAAGPNKDKVKYTCPHCAVNVWGKPSKPGLSILCGACGQAFTSKESPPAQPKVIAVLREPEAAARSLAEFFQGDDLWLFAGTFQDETGIGFQDIGMLGPDMEPDEMTEALQEWPEDSVGLLASILDDRYSPDEKSLSTEQHP
jgi:hypothetical protein